MAASGVVPGAQLGDEPVAIVFDAPNDLRRRRGFGIGVKDWPSFRDRTPFLAMPLLEVDGKAVTQSNSIDRYVGKLTGLYPQDDWQALLCDEIMDACEDIGTRLGNTINLSDDAKKKLREELVAERIPRYLEQLQARLQAAGGEYFADARLTVADLKVFNLVRWLANPRQAPIGVF